MSWMLASSDEFKAITPSDTVLLTYPNDQGDEITKKCKGIYVGGAGNLAIKNSAGNAITYIGVLAGVTYPFSTNQVMATNTTATNMVAIF